jgi:hypothetical protein
MWLNGRPVHTYIPPDEEETPWNKANNNVPYQQEEDTQQEAADMLAKTLGKKQLDPLPILGTNQPLFQQQQEGLEEEPEEESEEEDLEEGIPMVSSMQADDDD